MDEKKAGRFDSFNDFNPKRFVIGRPVTIVISGSGLTTGMAVTLVDSILTDVTWSPSSPFPPPGGVAGNGGATLSYTSTPTIAMTADREFPLDPLQGNLLVSVFDGDVIMPVQPIQSPVLYFTRPALVDAGASYTYTDFDPKEFDLDVPVTIVIGGTGLTSGMTVTLDETLVPGLTWSPSSAFPPPCGVAGPDGLTLEYTSTPSLAEGHELPLDPLQGNLVVTVYDGDVIQPTEPIRSPVLYDTKPGPPPDDRG